MVKLTQTLCRLLPTNWLGVFDHFVGFALKGLMIVSYKTDERSLLGFSLLQNQQAPTEKELRAMERHNYISIMSIFEIMHIHLITFNYLFTYFINETLCVIWYHTHYLKNMKNTQGGVLLLGKGNTPPLMFFSFFNLCKWCQVLQNITNT